MAKRYVVEKLSVAMDCLAVSTSPLQVRITDAWLSALMHLSPEDFDDENQRALFETIRLGLTSEESRAGSTTAQACARALSDEDALRIARALADLHGRVFPVR